MKKMPFSSFIEQNLRALCIFISLLTPPLTCIVSNRKNQKKLVRIGPKRTELVTNWSNRPVRRSSGRFLIYIPYLFFLFVNPLTRLNKPDRVVWPPVRFGTPRIDRYGMVRRTVIESFPFVNFICKHATCQK